MPRSFFFPAIGAHRAALAKWFGWHFGAYDVGFNLSLLQPCQCVSSHTRNARSTRYPKMFMMIICYWDQDGIYNFF